MIHLHSFARKEENISLDEKKIAVAFFNSFRDTEYLYRVSGILVGWKKFNMPRQDWENPNYSREAWLDRFEEKKLSISKFQESMIIDL